MISQSTFTIAAVERETGINKETLRIWERRYAFPCPQRSPAGKRVYLNEDVVKLKLIGLLIKQGNRPSKLMALNLIELKSKLTNPLMINTSESSIEQVSAWLKKGETIQLKNWLLSQIAKEGLRPFLENKLGPLITDIGVAWQEGRLLIHEEHLFSEILQQTLRTLINHLPVVSPLPHILITTPEGELHGLGLLIVESALALEGLKVTSLGVNTPNMNIAEATQQLNIHAVVMSMTNNFKTPAAREQLLSDLRHRLPKACKCYVGGSGIFELPPLTGVSYVNTLSDLLALVNSDFNN